MVSQSCGQYNSEAEYRLGTLYEEGVYVEKDMNEAIRLISRSRFGGNDSAKVADWLRKAADQGHAEAMSQLGECYEYGYGVPENKAEALKWYRKAYRNGDSFVRWRIKSLEEQHIQSNEIDDAADAAVETAI